MLLIEQFRQSIQGTLSNLLSKQDHPLLRGSLHALLSAVDYGNKVVFTESTMAMLQDKLMDLEDEIPQAYRQELELHQIAAAFLRAVYNGMDWDEWGKYRMTIWTMLETTVANAARMSASLLSFQSKFAQMMHVAEIGRDDAERRYVADVLAGRYGSPDAILSALRRDPQVCVMLMRIQKEESEGRAMTARFHGLLYRYKRDSVLRCLPVATWSYRDIWAYITLHHIDYNRVYDRMWDLPTEDQRVSYWAGETKRRWGRFVWLRLHSPELFNRFAERFPEVRNFV